MNNKFMERAIELSIESVKSQGGPFGACVVSPDNKIIGEGMNRVVVDKSPILHDAGKAINPSIELGQIECGFVQGAGWLTMEEVNWKSNGQLTIHSPSTYKIPAVSDMPEKFNVEIFKQGKNIENVINKSKTTGEPPLMNAMSVFFAIKNAIASITNYNFTPELNAPATPERILMSINKLKRKL